MKLCLLLPWAPTYMEYPTSINILVLYIQLVLRNVLNQNYFSLPIFVQPYKPASAMLDRQIKRIIKKIMTITPI